MKATLTFILPEELTEYHAVLQANDAKSMLWDFNQQLRSWRKHGNNFADASDALEKITEEFYKLLKQYKVEID